MARAEVTGKKPGVTADLIERDSGPPDPEDDEPTELWDRETVLKFFGGTKTLHISTLYRGMAADIYPKPVKTSVNSVRWLADECRDALRRMIAERDQPPKRPTYQGRPRGRKRRQIATDNV
jgi:predicted DNA-binding transcriptional regulator AlpA